MKLDLEEKYKPMAAALKAETPSITKLSVPTLKQTKRYLRQVKKIESAKINFITEEIEIL